MEERQISISAFRALIGLFGSQFSDQDLESFREHLYALGNLIAEAYREVSNLDVDALNPPGVEDALREAGWEVEDDEWDDERWLLEVA